MESSEVLRDSAMWAREQVKQVGVVGGLLNSVKKMTGAVPRIPTPSQVLQGSGQSEHDLVRQMAEMRVNRRSLQNHADPVCLSFMLVVPSAIFRPGWFRGNHHHSP